jgi:hypothetical protein
MAGLENKSISDLPFETRLSSDLRWAMSEGRVQQTLARISKRLDELGIPYAVAGGMALFLHGHRRFTEDVDILISRDDLPRVQESLEGRGFVRPFSTSKNLRDATTGVRIEFLISGDYPGDGKPKPVSFPLPQDVNEVRAGIKVLRLPQLIELKLASYKTGKGRTKDLGDVEELIKTLDLPRELAEQLNSYIADLYLQRWDEIHS